MPFDWARVPERSLLSILASDLQHYVRRENLAIPSGSSVLKDTLNQVTLMHDTNHFRLEGALAVESTYARRIAAFQRLASSEQPIVLVRGETSETFARALLQSMQSRYPNTRFSIVGVRKRAAISQPVWRSAGSALNLFDVPKVSSWKGSNNAWSEMTQLLISSQAPG